GSNVDIVAGKHQHNFDRVDVPIRLQGGHYDPVTIGPDAWIGNGATLIEDVGPHAIVAAGSVVVKPVGAWSIVGGNPAKFLKSRLPDGQREASNGNPVPPAPTDLPDSARI